MLARSCILALRLELVVLGELVLLLEQGRITHPFGVVRSRLIRVIDCKWWLPVLILLLLQIPA